MSRAYGTRESWLAALRAEGAGFREAISAESSLDAPVPSRPEWTSLDLVQHLGVIYDWTATHLARGVTTPPEPTPSPAEQTLPQGPTALAWWDEKFAALLALLEEIDPRLPAWNWAPQTKTAAFWFRRMAHETAIHRWDAQSAIGTPDPIDTALAVDGVAEVLDTWLPSGQRRAGAGRKGIVHLYAADAGVQWFVRLRGEGIALLDTSTLLDTSPEHERVTAAGTASDLVLTLYGRLGFENLEVTGDAGLLDALRTA